jgi:hypothetical protein
MEKSAIAYKDTILHKTILQKVFGSKITHKISKTLSYHIDKIKKIQNKWLPTSII